MDGDIYSFGKVKILTEITSGFISNLFRSPVAALVSQLRGPGDAVPADSEVGFAAEAFFAAAGKAFQVQRPSAIIAMKVGFGGVGKEIHGLYRVMLLLAGSASGGSHYDSFDPSAFWEIGKLVPLRQLR